MKGTWTFGKVSRLFGMLSQRYVYALRKYLFGRGISSCYVIVIVHNRLPHRNVGNHPAMSIRSRVGPAFHWNQTKSRTFQKVQTISLMFFFYLLPPHFRFGCRESAWDCVFCSSKKSTTAKKWRDTGVIKECNKDKWKCFLFMPNVNVLTRCQTFISMVYLYRYVVYSFLN